MNMMSRWLLSAVVFLSVSGTSRAACFRILGEGPAEVGPVKLWGPASEVCVFKVNRLGGPFYSVDFRDAQGDLAKFASPVELRSRCPGYCNNYILQSGQSNGSNENPDNTQVNVHVEGLSPRFGTVSLSHPLTGMITYQVELIRKPTEPVTAPNNTKVCHGPGNSTLELSATQDPELARSALAELTISTDSLHNPGGKFLLLLSRSIPRGLNSNRQPFELAYANYEDQTYAVSVSTIVNPESNSSECVFNFTKQPR